MTDTEWLKTLKAGDRVVAKGEYPPMNGGDELTLTVVAVHKNYVVTDHKKLTRFHRDTLLWTKAAKKYYGCDGRWRLVGTPETVAEEKERFELWMKLDRFRSDPHDFRKRTTDQLRRIVAILNEGTSE